MWVYGGTLIPASSEVAGVRVIAAADPQFALDDFLAFARSVHDNVHRATASRDLTPVIGTLDQPMIEWLAGRYDEREWQSAVGTHAHTAVIDAAHGTTDTITVRFGASIGGRKTVTDWTFSRSATEYAHLRGVVPTECTSCGAPLNLDAHGNCRFCATHLVGVAGRWTVTEIAPPRTLEAPKPTASLEALDPNFPVQDFLRFAHTVYWNVHAAAATGEVSSIRDILTTEMRAYLASKPDDLYWDLPITEMRGLDVVDAQHGAMDRVTVRFRSWSPDVGDPETDIVEDWTFERPASMPPHRYEPPDSCSFCGAAISLDENGNCRYCGTHLLGVEGSWRLTTAGMPQQELQSHPLAVKAMQNRGCRFLLLLSVFGTVLVLIVGFFVLLVVSKF